ncbi:MAG: hypothetical protein ACRECA_05745, partial [Pseudolabrys sp.]
MTVDAPIVSQTDAVHWIGPHNGDWNTPGNWSTGKVPIPHQDVFIDTAVSITSSGTVNIASLAVSSGATLEITGGNFSIPTSTNARPLSNAGTISIDAGAALVVGETGLVGAVINSGTLHVNGGTLSLIDLTVNNAGATVQVDSTSFLTLADATISGGSLSNDGTLSSSGASELDGVATSTSNLLKVTAGTLTIHQGSLANTGSGELLATGGGTLALQSVTVTDDAGATVQVDSTSFLTLADATISGGSLTNAGTLSSIGASELDGVATSSSNLLEVTAGTLTIHEGSLANTGSGELLATTGGTLALESVTVSDDAGAKVQVDASSFLTLE